MSNPNYSELTYSLAPGENLAIAQVGDFVSTLAASADFNLSIDNGPETNFRQGLTYRSPENFQRLTLRNTSAMINIITLVIGTGDMRDARLVLSGGISTKPAASLFVDGGAVSALATANTALLAANPARKEAVIYNDGAALVYIRGDAVAAAGGVGLAAGGALVLETTAAVFAYNGGAGAVSVLVSELVVV